MSQAVGELWSACDALKKAPLGNKAALFKHIAHALTVVKDTQREMGELAAHADQNNEEEGGGEWRLMAGSCFSLSSVCMCCRVIGFKEEG